MKTFYHVLLGGLLLFLPFNGLKAQAYTENFDNIATLSASDWVTLNNSVPVGLNPNWGQGDAAVFPAFNGATNAYVFANFQMTTGANTISAWMITPNRTLKNGDVFSFYTRKPVGTDFPDRLEVRLSTNGASTNVGTGPATVGDFTTVLLTINPALSVGVYPTSWTQYTITISGLSAPTSGRIAFRYFVTNGGPSGANSDYIGIDQVDYTPYTCPSFTLTAGGALTGATAGTAYSNTLTQTGALGTPNFAITGGALPSGLTLSSTGLISGTPTATGTFNFTVTVNDASGCSGSQSYSITSVCPSNPIAFSSSPTLCDNASDYTLAEASPAGGTYSGTGVTSGMFDPSFGTQTITYAFTDAYGCAHNSNYSITVNTAPTVTLGAFADMCDNDGVLNLTGESPAGGTFSGTGVSGATFDPTNGTQTVTYTFTDGNGCTNNATQTITVNTAPTVSFDPIADVCENAGTITLGGVSPTGGVFTGTGVSGNQFDPTVGTQTIMYEFTDLNGCSNNAMQDITVIPSETATLSTFTAVCENEGTVVLTGGLPAGGTYSGTGVSGTSFDPSNGTQTITYTIGGGTACESSASQTFTVLTAPTVTLNLGTTSACINHSAFTLTGGAPTFGTYSGTGVTGGSFSPSSAGLGTSTITYTFVDGNGCSNQATGTITVDACADLSELTAVELTVYPNPTSGTVVLKSSENLSLDQLNVKDLNGKTLSVSGLSLSTNEVLLNLEELPNGLYFITYAGIERNQTIRIIKQ